jgi:putative flippase GtrA
MLNRSLVFAVVAVPVGGKRGEYSRYFAIQAVGALLNLAIFSLLIFEHPLLESIPLIPLAIGALFGLLFNYGGARYWVFRGRG